MKLPSRRRIKKELNRRLIYHPLLRMLLFKKAFRVGFFACLLLGLIAALYLPKVWTTSPESFLPIVKVSAMDMTQAWSLKRTARKAESRGDFQEANLSWQTAIANNPADEEAVKGFLRNLMRLEKPDKRLLGVGVGQTLWLLRLARTNAHEVELAAQFYDHFRFHDVALYVLEPIADKLPEGAKVPYLKALFQQGKYTQFGQALKKIGAEKIKDAELRLYEKAYLAGWVQGPESTEAFNSLRENRNQTEMKSLANRLYLAIASKRSDVQGYGESLRELEKRNEATVADHTGYWKALVATGQRMEARELALAFTSSPASGAEAVKLAEAYHELGLVEQAREVLKRFAPQFGYSPEVWLVYASLLEDAKDWTEMRAVALQMRRLEGVRDTMENYSHFLEGRAELGFGRQGTAENEFKQAVAGQFVHPAVGLMVAKELTQLNYPVFAKQILFRLEEPLAERFDYWEACFDAAFKLRDSEWILKAATKTHEAKPHDPALMNRYVAALIVNRARAEESVKYTLELIVKYPNSLAAVVNHSLALLQNHRTSEAGEVLGRVNPTALSASEGAAYYLALFELQLQRGQVQEAITTAAKIDRSQIFPGQAEWLQEKLLGLPTGERKV
jgi:hypothetical protein